MVPNKAGASFYSHTPAPTAAASTASTSAAAPARADAATTFAAAVLMVDWCGGGVLVDAQ